MRAEAKASEGGEPVRRRLGTVQDRRQASLEAPECEPSFHEHLRVGAIQLGGVSSDIENGCGATSAERKEPRRGPLRSQTPRLQQDGGGVAAAAAPGGASGSQCRALEKEASGDGRGGACGGEGGGGGIQHTSAVAQDKEEEETREAGHAEESERRGRGRERAAERLGAADVPEERGERTTDGASGFMSAREWLSSMTPVASARTMQFTPNLVTL